VTYQLIENFISGQDTRKSPLTSAAGTLTRLINAMITPGGEIAKRRAFVNVGSVAGSFGLAATESSLFVFGRNVDPVVPNIGVPGVNLRACKIPNTDTSLEQTDYDVFDGNVYLACRTGASLFNYPTEAQNPHYYLGVRPSTVIYDGKLSEGSGRGYYVRTFQSKVYAVINKLLNFSAIGNPVVWDEEALIDKVVVVLLSNTNPAICTVSAAEIGQFTAGRFVYIAGATKAGLTGANGYRQIGTVGATTFTLNGVNGSTATSPGQNDSKVSATPAISVQSISNTNPARCTIEAGAIAKFSEGMKVQIYLPAPGPGWPAMVSGPRIVTQINVGTNSFALSGIDASALAPQSAAGWCTLTSDVIRTGRGFINISTVDADSEKLTSLEVYYDKLAIFSTQATQIWAVDPDPLQNAFEQLLRGAGTTAPRSPLQYGSGDVLYLDPSGIRSLKAKDSSNSAAVSDIGSPVDPAVRGIRLDPLKGTLNYADEAVSLLEPSVGRFWMIFPREILCLSYFPGPKITAWSTLTLPELAGAEIDHAVTCGGKIFLRDSADNLWVYGGTDGKAYNNPGVEVRLPYHDSKKPGHKKEFQAFDATVNSADPPLVNPGTWRVAVSYDYNNPDAEETIANIAVPTWNFGSHELQGYDSHFSLRFYNNDNLEATISNAAVHYAIADEEA
jgi:hypothetical protein